MFAQGQPDSLTTRVMGAHTPPEAQVYIHATVIPLIIALVSNWMSGEFTGPGGTFHWRPYHFAKMLDLARAQGRREPEILPPPRTGRMHCPWPRHLKPPSQTSPISIPSLLSTWSSI